ncbi:toxin-antitoxin system protein [Lachnospiraceae bacterium]|nr:toxin-antitoxin system protein [Lachnospiraceae bacterium]
MKPLKAKVSITIDNNIVEVLKTLAEEDDRSLSQYINLILKRYLKDIKKQENRKS